MRPWRSPFRHEHRLDAVDRQLPFTDLRFASDGNGVVFPTSNASSSGENPFENTYVFEAKVEGARRILLNPGGEADAARLG